MDQQPTSSERSSRGRSSSIFKKFSPLKVSSKMTSPKLKMKAVEDQSTPKLDPVLQPI